MELVEYTKKTAPHLLAGIIAQFGCDLRISQLIALRSNDIEPHRLWTVEDKRENAHNCTDAKVGPHWKDIWHPEAGKILLAIQAGTPPGQLLFPRSSWTVPEYNRHLKQAATALGYPKELKYDGSHVLRHAGAAAAIKLLGDLDPTYLSQKLKMSPAMVAHYSASLEQRLRKVFKK